MKTPFDQINAEIAETLHEGTTEATIKWAKLVKQRSKMKDILQASMSGNVPDEVKKQVEFCQKYIRFYTDSKTSLEELAKVWQRSFWHIFNNSKDYQNNYVHTL
jgi:hypothetical protein